MVGLEVKTLLVQKPIRGVLKERGSVAPTTGRFGSENAVRAKVGKHCHINRRLVLPGGLVV